MSKLEKVLEAIRSPATMADIKDRTGLRESDITVNLSLLLEAGQARMSKNTDPVLYWLAS